MIRNERGEKIAEYVSSVLPPEERTIMNLRPISSKQPNVEVIKVEQFPLPGHTIVSVTVKPAT